MKLFRVKKTCCYGQPSCKLSSDHTEGYHNHLLQLYLNKTRLSSAKLTSLDEVVPLLMSDIIIKNNSGPRTVPWGTTTRKLDCLCLCHLVF